MNLSEKKENIDRALKDIVLPEIKKLGFVGSYPHFRKKEGQRFEFVSFQFGRSSLVGSFVVEFGYINADELQDWAKPLPFSKLNYGHAKHRKRIKPAKLEDADYWFDYSKFNKAAEYNNLAHSVKALLAQGAEFVRSNT